MSSDDLTCPIWYILFVYKLIPIFLISRRPFLYKYISSALKLEIIENARGYFVVVVVFYNRNLAWACAYKAIKKRDRARNRSICQRSLQGNKCNRDCNRVTQISAVDSEFCNCQKCSSQTVDPAVDSSSPVQGAKHAVLIYISLVRKQFLNGKCSDLIWLRVLWPWQT